LFLISNQSLTQRAQREDAKGRKAKENRKELIMIRLPKKFRASLTLGIALAGLMIFIPACSHNKLVQIGTHKVTVTRHGFEKRLRVDWNAPSLEYAGVATDGKGLKVSIQGDKVMVNGVAGQLHPGDSVFISDEGVRVNSMDYGESEKYLRGNGSTAVSSLN
jgi:hypothetical protein